jgi:hypothetical protein
MRLNSVWEILVEMRAAVTQGCQYKTLLFCPVQLPLFLLSAHSQDRSEVRNTIALTYARVCPVENFPSGTLQHC